jgi:hypothetical protein
MNRKQYMENLKAIRKEDQILLKMIDKEQVHRCPVCDRFLFVGELGAGSLIAIHCYKCSDLRAFAVPADSPGG